VFRSRTKIATTILLFAPTVQPLLLWGGDTPRVTRPLTPGIQTDIPTGEHQGTTITPPTTITSITPVEVGSEAEVGSGAAPEAATEAAGSEVVETEGVVVEEEATEAVAEVETGAETEQWWVTKS
jgi:hypothetical protein